MVAFLSQAWLDRQRELSQALPARPGANAHIQYEIAVAAKATTAFHTVVEDGRITANQLGPTDDAEFTMQIPVAEFDRWLAGDNDLQVAFMQGRIKVVGNIGRMLSVLPMTTSAEWHAATAMLAAETVR